MTQPLQASVLVGIASTHEPPREQLAAHFAPLADSLGVTITHGEAPAPGTHALILAPLNGGNGPLGSAVHLAARFRAAAELAELHGTPSVLIVGEDYTALPQAALYALLSPVSFSGVDLSLPNYTLPASAGLLNTGILRPLVNTLFAVPVHMALTAELALSRTLLQRLARPGGAGDAALFPVVQAALGSFSLAEVATGPRPLPHIEVTLPELLQSIVGALYSDVEANAAFWQRTRAGSPILHPGANFSAPRMTDEEATPDSELEQLLETFRLGYRNLMEVWSPVLPPQTLVTLKRLSNTPLASFNLPDALWARTVYDFALAHRLRTLPRGQLLAAMAPLYLAWVASHLLELRSAGGGEALAARLVRAFEAERPYFVSRWRWPDRFNP